MIGFFALSALSFTALSFMCVFKPVGGFGRNFAIFLGISLVGVIGAYLFLGRPLLPDHPYQKIQTLSSPSDVLETQAHLAKQEHYVRDHPEDAKGWNGLGDMYFKLKQFYKAALIYREAWKIKPESYDYKFSYAKALLYFDNMKVTGTTLQLLKELHQERPTDPNIKVLLKYVGPIHQPN